MTDPNRSRRARLGTHPPRRRRARRARALSLMLEIEGWRCGATRARGSPCREYGLSRLPRPRRAQPGRAASNSAGDGGARESCPSSSSRATATSTPRSRASSAARSTSAQARRRREAPRHLLGRAQGPPAPRRPLGRAPQGGRQGPERPGKTLLELTRSPQRRAHASELGTPSAPCRPPRQNLPEVGIIGQPPRASCPTSAPHGRRASPAVLRRRPPLSLTHGTKSPPVDLSKLRANPSADNAADKPSAARGSGSPEGAPSNKTTRCSLQKEKHRPRISPAAAARRRRHGTAAAAFTGAAPHRPQRRQMGRNPRNRRRARAPPAAPSSRPDGRQGHLVLEKLAFTRQHAHAQGSQRRRPRAPPRQGTRTRPKTTEADARRRRLPRRSRTRKFTATTPTAPSPARTLGRSQDNVTRSGALYPRSHTLRSEGQLRHRPHEGCQELGAVRTGPRRTEDPRRAAPRIAQVSPPSPARSPATTRSPPRLRTATCATADPRHRPRASAPTSSAWTSSSRRRVRPPARR